MKRNCKIKACLTMCTFLLLFLAKSAGQSFGMSYQDTYDAALKMGEQIEKDGGKAPQFPNALLPPEEDTGESEETPYETPETETKSVVKSTKASDKATGPGMEAEKTEAAQGTLPVVKQESLSETFHEDFDIYEENLANQFFIYSNVGNGGITDQPVIIDLPQNMTFVLEQNGVAIPYTGQEVLGERGTYVLKLSALSSPVAPLKDQVIYESVFRFRIQEKPVKKEEESKAEADGFSGYPWGGSSGYSYPDSAVKEAGQDSDSFWREAADQEGLGETTGGETLGEGREAGSGDSLADGEELSTEEDSFDEIFRQEAVQCTGFSSLYDQGQNLYRNTLLTGNVFYSSVPNGMITNNAVTLIPDLKMEFSIQKNGEPFTADSGYEFTEPGSYRVQIKEPGTEFAVVYQEETSPEFYFRIIDGAVADMLFFNRPLQLTFQSVLRDGERMETADSYFLMEQDGVYEISMEGGGRSLEVSIVKDTKAPGFSVDVGKGKASITYGSDDIAEVLLIKNGKNVQSGMVHELSGKGEYRLEVYDRAGNVSIRTFYLPFAMNVAAVIACILAVLSAAGIAFFLIKTKGSFTVK